MKTFLAVVIKFATSALTSVLNNFQLRGGNMENDELRRCVLSHRPNWNYVQVISLRDESTGEELCCELINKVDEATSCVGAVCDVSTSLAVRSSPPSRHSPSC